MVSGYNFATFEAEIGLLARPIKKYSFSENQCKLSALRVISWDFLWPQFHNDYSWKDLSKSKQIWLQIKFAIEGNDVNRFSLEWLCSVWMLLIKLKLK